MATLNITHALPNSFLPAPGSRLTVVGLSLGEAKALVQKAATLANYVRYPDFSNKLGELFGVQLPEAGLNCPPPSHGEGLLVCSLSPGTSEIRFYRVYDSTSEHQDHAWRYGMTAHA